MIALLLLTATADAADVGGYFRVQARPDLVGGDARLGNSAFHGRLLNEGPWALLELRQDLVKRDTGSKEPWSDVHLRVEGGSLAGAEGVNGLLSSFRVSQFYFQAGNVGARDVTFRFGTLETTFGDLWLYDARPTQMLTDVLGASATWSRKGTEVVVGAGDAGFSIHGVEYHAVPSLGGTVRQSVGVGGQVWAELEGEGDPTAPATTTGVSIESWRAGAISAGEATAATEPTGALAYKAAGYVGFGKAGPLTWNRLQVVYQRRLPEGPLTVDDAKVYGAGLTDERDELLIGNEMELAVVPEKLDVAWAVMLDHRTDGDDHVTDSATDRTGLSTVLRAQYAMAPTVALLGETSVAREIAHNGDAFRSGGLTNDTPLRDTWQGKAGVVINPAGPGMGSRPALRALYGAQYSTETSSWPGAVAEADRHWHHLVSLEAEAWF